MAEKHATKLRRRGQREQRRRAKAFRTAEPSESSATRKKRNPAQASRTPPGAAA
jgi:hypothetical protein